MLEVDVPGAERLQICYLVLDFNGTVAVDGALIAGVAERLNELAQELAIHVLTADTFGTVRAAMAQVTCEVAVLEPGAGAVAKKRYVEQLGAERVAAIGNGYNDRLMLRAAALGIAVIQEEGAAAATLAAADLVTRDIRAALDLLRRLQRLVASLRA